MPPAMSDDELAACRQAVNEFTGIQMDGDKKYWLETCLQDLMQSLSCRDYKQLLGMARADPTVQRRFVDAVSIKETFFFRDRKYFDLLKFKLFPEMFGDDPQRPLRIWSAACSTGQEAYSICIVLKELLFDLTKARVRILGTDVSEAAVNMANKGEYLAFDLGRGLSPQELSRYFRDVGGRFRVNDELRSLCRFQVDNLLRSTVVGSGSFDIILLRNVLIYFTAAERKKLIDRMVAALAPQGALILGATEGILQDSPAVVREEFRDAVYYRRKR
jgi:chemotaxis protein methyltransferase CheR